MQKPREIEWTTNENGCWICTSHSLNRDMGYPEIVIKGKLVKIVRVMFENKYGAIGKGLCTCHKCDTPSCINPDHVFIGTQRDNILDGTRKLRIGPPKILDPLRVRQIRNLGYIGIKQRTIANQFGISRTMVHLIINRKRWKGIGDIAEVILG